MLVSLLVYWNSSDLVCFQTVYEESEVNGLQAEETDTDDDIGSFHDDRADSSDEDEPGRVKSHDLEWDSTTATYWLVTALYEQHVLLKVFTVEFSQQLSAKDVYHLSRCCNLNDIILCQVSRLNLSVGC